VVRAKFLFARKWETTMTLRSGLRFIAEEARLLAKQLPSSVVDAVAHALGSADAVDSSACCANAVRDLAHAHYRSLVVAFLDGWQVRAAEVAPQAVAAALLTAATTEKAHREYQSVELVWTGPDVGVVPFRRTEQALLQVIESATERLTVVSYAVYNIPRIRDALLRAADRGVAIKIVVESPDRIEGQKAYNTLIALGPSVANRCSVYLWPPEQRQRDDNGKLGILHVKCAVADGRWLFLSSANLTEYAFTLNMELGLLVTGANLPGQVEAHFERMIQTGVLTRG
jgi:phosphatidylserine/phosphatidylglycerophosphate/cardiolipin synthase-like enzyme